MLERRRLHFILGQSHFCVESNFLSIEIVWYDYDALRVSNTIYAPSMCSTYIIMSMDVLHELRAIKKMRFHAPICNHTFAFLVYVQIQPYSKQQLDKAESKNLPVSYKMCNLRRCVILTIYNIICKPINVLSVSHICHLSRPRKH